MNKKNSVIFSYFFPFVSTSQSLGLQFLHTLQQLLHRLRRHQALLAVGPGEVLHGDVGRGSAGAEAWGGDHHGASWSTVVFIRCSLFKRFQKQSIIIINRLYCWFLNFGFLWHGGWWMKWYTHENRLCDIVCITSCPNRHVTRAKSNIAEVINFLWIIPLVEIWLLYMSKVYIYIYSYIYIISRPWWWFDDCR